MLRKFLESGSTSPPKAFGSSKNKIEVKNQTKKRILSKVNFFIFSRKTKERCKAFCLNRKEPRTF